MLKRSGRLLAAIMAVVVVVGAMSACGGGSGSSAGSSTSTDPARATPDSSEVVARVGAVPITRGDVSHWMATLAGGDYYDLSGRHTVPPNLVSDPPRYSACVASLEAAVAAAPNKTYQASGVQLLSKCRQLYRALKTQATGVLIVVHRVDRLASDLGISASDAEVLAAYRKISAEEFPTQVAVSRNLASRRTNVADELVLIRKDLLARKVLAKIKAPGNGGPVGLRVAEASVTAKTTCRPGYVVEYCKEFHGEQPRSAANLPASVLMEQVAALATGRCVNLDACGKQ